MDPDFWLKRWQNSEIGFHAAHVQPTLRQHWSRLGLTAGATVFVPLAGKSLDMTWLAQEGFNVVGCELSELAVDQFFAECGATPETRTVGTHTVKSSGNIEIWCGDFFTLSAATMPPLNAFYDRAALVAMPPSMQARYATQLSALMPPNAKGLLIGLDYNPQEMSGPPFAIPRSRVSELLSPTFDIDLIDARDGLAKAEHLAKRGVTRLEEASYLMTRRT
jgi:thiopurine S-methyltransferase